MIVLALDTALEACSVAVTAGGVALAVRSEPMTRGHQERLAPLVAEAMVEARLGFSALDRIVVTVGPGSFTGLRVGLAFAKAMGLAMNIPCLGIGTLEALAASAPRDAPLVVAALDARRGQIYLQGFRHGVALAPPDVLPIETARARLTAWGVDAATVRVGSGSSLLMNTAEGVAPGSVAAIDPLCLARLGASLSAAERPPQPLYLRSPDARTIAERLAMAAV